MSCQYTVVLQTPGTCVKFSLFTVIYYLVDLNNCHTLEYLTSLSLSIGNSIQQSMFGALLNI